MGLMIVDSDWLDVYLTTMADILREKTGTADLINFPEGFIIALNSMKNNGGIEDYLKNENMEITIPNDIQNLRAYAFYNWTNLTKVTIDSNAALTSIGEYAFYNTKITDITLPKNLTSIASNAFSGCSNLTITLYASEGEIAGAPWGATNATIIYDNYDADIELTGTMIDTYDIVEDDGSVNLSKRIDKNGMVYRITSIGSNAFKARTDVTSVHFPKYITKINDSAFRSCSNLASITFEEEDCQLTHIGQYAFYESIITDISIPDSVTYLGAYAFMYCGQLTTYKLSNSLTTINQSTFYYCRKLTQAIIPEGVTTIALGAFCYCSAIKEVSIPETVTSIGESAFFYLRSVSHIDVPDSVVEIGKNAFYEVPKVIYAGTATGSPWGALKVSSTPLISFALILGPSGGSYTELTAWAELNMSWAEWCQNAEYNPLYKYRENATDTIYCGTSNVYYFQYPIADGPITLNGINVKSTDTIVANATYYGIVDTSRYD